MRFKLLHIAILILFWINLIPSSGQLNDCRESFIQNISIPGGQITDGINPEDIIFADNKYFVAGLGTVLVLNTAFEVINTINLTERGAYGYEASSILANNPTHCLMAFDGNNKLFVISPDNEICIINTSGSGSLETTRIPKPGNVPSLLFTKSIIRFDPVNDRIYWVITWNIEQIAYSYLGCYSTLSSENYSNIWNHLFSENQIMDICISDIITLNNLSYYYLARRNTLEVYRSDAPSYLIPNRIISSTGDRKRLLYIHTNQLHRVYCISSTNLDWIDGNNFNTSNSLPAPFSAVNCLAYNNETNELFLGGNLYLYIYDASNATFIESKLLSENNNDGPIYRLECFSNKIYASMPDKLIGINGTNHQFDILLSKQNNFFGPGAYNSDPNNNGIIILNMEGSSLETFDFQDAHENILTGVSVYKSCNNPDDAKFYFYSDEQRDYSKIVIIKHNSIDNSYDLDEILSYDINGSQSNISSCAYNESENHLLISSYSETNKILKRNGNDNSAAGYFTLNNGYCEKVFVTHQLDNKIYCATAMNSLSDASIEIFNAEDYSFEALIDQIGNGNEDYEYRTEFCYNAIDNDVYVLLCRRSTGPSTYGKLIIIDQDNNYDNQIINLPGNPDKLVFSEVSNKIYIKYLSQDFVTEYDCNNPNDPLSNFDFGSTVKDIDYGKYFNTLYILTTGADQKDYIHGYSCYVPFEESRHWWEAKAWCISLKYNQLNQRIYAFSPFEYINNYKSHLTVFDHYKVDTVELNLHNSQCVRYANPDLYNNLVVDPVTGYLLVPNGSHSNISVIRCPEKFELTNRINWISFPRLDRNPDNDESIDSKVALTDRIIPGPDYTFLGQMKYLAYDPGNPQAGIMTTIDKATYTSPWNQTLGALYEVYSNRGYQLQVTPDQQFIYFFGHIQDPDVPVELEGTPVDRFSNWVGYYLTYPQSPFDAIPENVLENLTMISGQYWSCARYNPAPIESGSDCWRCAINQGRIEINYGDMVKLTSKANTSFTWQQNNSNEPSVEKLKSESFVYNEQYNYEALFIELDTNDIPEEIGAFAGDSCVGATKVLPGDTTVLICAYTEGYEGEDITFEFSYTTKAARINQPDYFVLNQGTGKSERRRIKAGEDQPCHFVSFKQTNDDQSNAVTNGLNCYPNPASEAFSLSCFIPEDGYVKLEILNPLGLIVLTKPFGYLTQGNHSFNVQTVGLPAGYYFVRLFIGKQINVGTLLINR